MKALILFWNRMERGARWRLGAGAVFVVALTAWLAYRTMHVDYDVLFTQLSESDAGTIVAELKRQKVPYRLAGDGTTIEVPSLQVHETRLRLMSGGLPLSGAVGFEIFDKQGLGATEQSQRVSYQRALQGELARTIGTIEGVRQARVHLVLPESTLFRRDRQDARAAVTLAMNHGVALGREQILGVQRLVAASVAGLDPGKVIVTDQRGITLSGPDSLGGDASLSERRLVMKRDIEEYITRKVARLLDSTYGPGQALVSVDVLLNFDEIHRTVQDLQPSGIRRRRQVVAAGSADEGAAVPAATDASPATPNSSMEVEYEYGRKVEQVIAAPGGITRLSVGVVVPGDLSPDKQQRIADLVRVAAGVNEQRGDAIVVQPLDQLSSKASQEHDVEEAVPPVAAAKSAPVARAWSSPFISGTNTWIVAALAAGALLLFVLAQRLLQGRARHGVPPVLSTEQRQNLLLEIERALETGAPAQGTRMRT
jgi:flagellar M-ring protein FliF